MNSARHILLSMVIALLCCTAVFGQKLRYDVILFGKKIGQTTVEMRDSSGIRHLILRSNTQVKMLFMDKRSAMSTDVLFNKDGVMFSSIFENIKEDGKILTKALWDQGKLYVDKNGEKSVLPNAVKASSLSLYFSEPTNLQKIFSERLGEFFQMTKQSDGKYYAQIKGNEAVYTYSKGTLSEMEIKSAIGSIYVRRID